MRQETHAPPSIPVIRVISTPIPSARLTRDLAVQLRAMYDDLLREPLPDRFRAMIGFADVGTSTPLTKGDERWSSNRREWP